MPLNTRFALDDVRSAITQARTTASGFEAEARNLTANISSVAENLYDDSILRQVRNLPSSLGNINSVLEGGIGGVTNEITSAVNNLTSELDIGYGIGQVDPGLAAAVLGDATSGLPSPSSIQALGSAPTGALPPSIAGRQNQNFSNVSPRPWFRIDPGDNRYDFITGQKVRTGTGSNAGINTPAPGGSSAPPPNQSRPLVNSPASIGYGKGQVDPALAAAAGLNTSAIDIGYDVGQIDPALAQAAGLGGNLMEQIPATDIRAVEDLVDQAQEAGGTVVPPLTEAQQEYARMRGYVTTPNPDTADDARAARNRAADPSQPAPVPPPPSAPTTPVNTVQDQQVPRQENSFFGEPKGFTITGFYVPYDFPITESDLEPGDLFLTYYSEYDEATDSTIYIDYEVLKANGQKILITL